MTRIFPDKPRREDPEGHMIVQRNLDFLKDELDDFDALFDWGSDTITAGNTFVTVVHSLGATFQVAVTPVEDPLTRYWVSDKAAGSFRINLAAAQLTDIDFDWLAREEV